MIEQLANLQPNEMITIDNDPSKRLTGLEDFTISEVFNYEFDGQRLAIVEMNDDDYYYLIATDMGGDPLFAVCEQHDEDCGDTQYLNNEGNFLDEIELTGGESSVVYRMTNSLSSNEEDDEFAEYISNDHYDYLLLWKQEDCVYVYRGLTINENAVLI